MTASSSPGNGVSQPVRAVRDLAHGRWKAEVLDTVLRLGIPDLLGDEPVAVEQLAAATGAHPEALGRLLHLAATLGLCEKADGPAFRATEETALLRSEHPGPLRTECRHVLSEWGRIAWTHLELAVRTGNSGFTAATGVGVFDFLAEHPSESAVFHAFQGQVTRRNAAALRAADLLPATGVLIDVGGGNGTLLSTLLADAPGLRGVVYDRAEVVDQGDLGDCGGRLSRVAGDFIDPSAGEPLPAGADVYLLSHVLHDWPDEQAVAILAGIAAALGPDSRLLVLENVLQDGCPSLLVNYLDVLMLTAWGSRERSVAAYQELFRQAGLVPVAEHPLAPAGGLTALLARRHRVTSAPPCAADVRTSSVRRVPR
ncbi:MAG: methyltransferase [Pseudonocardiaceae bacterium]